MFKRIKRLWGRNKRQERRWKKEFYEEVKDLTRHPVVLRMKLYPHHGVTSCYAHCLSVAYQNYKWSRILRLDARAAARGAMLHDLFLYDWHECRAKTGNPVHGLTHPESAYKNARKFFRLGRKEKDVIRTHMWPLTLWRIPETKEGWLTVITDKYCGALETCKRKEKRKRVKGR